MLKLIKSGFYTTVQDRGRFGYRDKGVPLAGVMDHIAISKANKLLENDNDAAVLEITMTGPTIEFEESTFIVISGASMAVTLNNQSISNDTVYKITPGDVLSYGRLEKGLRNYLAVKDGFKTKLVLGSRSFSKSVTPQSVLKDKSMVPYTACSSFIPKISRLETENYLGNGLLDVVKGPEYEILGDRQLEKIFSGKFTVAKENNRMAYQLEEKVNGHSISMLTSATLPGTIQITPSGKLIVLMKDGQTTGGYPRILQLTDKAISILSQKKFGDKISFKILQ